MKKIPLKLGLLVFGVAGLLFFSGCTLPQLPFLPKPKPSEGKITLKYWGLWEPKANMQALIDEYQKSNPNIVIDYEERTPKFYYETLKSRISGTTGPDIFRMHLTWVPRLTPKLAALPASIMDSATYKSTFYPTVSEWCSDSKNNYCLPLMYDGLAMIYNQSLFDQAGIKEPPKTWEDFKTAAKKLTVINDKGAVAQAGAAIGTAENVTEFSDLLGLLILQNGGQFQDPKTGDVVFHQTVTADGRNTGVEALEYYTQFAQGENKVWDRGLGESTQAFVDGKVGMIFATSWRLQNIIASNPALKLVVAPVPQLPTESGGMTNINWASYWVEGVSAQSTHQSEAWSFLKFITEREQLLNFQKAVTTSSGNRAFGEMYPRQDLAATLLNDPYLSTYIAAAPTAKTWYMCDRTQDELLTQAVKGYMAQAVDSAAAGGNVENVLTAAAQSAQSLLSQTEK